MSARRILLGAEYLHRPTGERVIVVDFEYRRRSRKRRDDSARTGRLVVRAAQGFFAPRVVLEEELAEPPPYPSANGGPG